MAFTVGKQNLPGYNEPWGEKIVQIYDATGPASYTTFVPSTGLGGDIDVMATNGLNIGGIDYVGPTVDTTGQIICYPVFTQGGNGNAVGQYTKVFFSLVTATLGGQSQTAGAQIASTTNLSTFSWRFMLIGV